MLYFLLLTLFYPSHTLATDAPVGLFYPKIKSIPVADFGNLPTRISECVEGDCKQGEGVYLTVVKSPPLADGSTPVRVELAKGTFSEQGRKLDGYRYTDAFQYEHREPQEFVDPRAAFPIVKANYIIRGRQPSETYSYRYSELLDYYGSFEKSPDGYVPLPAARPTWKDKVTAVGTVFYLDDIPVYEARKDGYQGIPMAGSVQVGMRDVEDESSGTIGYTKAEFEQILPHLRWEKYGLNASLLSQLSTPDAYSAAFTVVNGRPQRGYYVGTRKDGKLHGNGVFYSDSLVYIGCFKQGRPHDAGFVYERPIGTRKSQIWSIGNFMKGGLLEGIFKKSFYQNALTLDTRAAAPKRTIFYQGTFKKGRPHGCGTLKGVDFGSITDGTYQGYIEEGKTIGWATLNGRPVLLGDASKLTQDGTPEQRARKDMAAGNVFCGSVKPKDLEELYQQGKKVKVLTPVRIE